MKACCEPVVVEYTEGHFICSKGLSVTVGLLSDLEKG